MSGADSGVYTQIPTFSDFAEVFGQAVYRPLPESWWIGLTDVVDSTGAIESGQYKRVNMAGAAAISAVMNALGHRDFPFVFGGDGSSFAVSSDDRAAAEAALAHTATWVAEELDLSLRVAMVPVQDIQANGREVEVARFAASPGVSYAMFSGQGIAWAEEQMKADRYAVTPSPAGTRPDLTGLSCRWTPIENRRGCILSLLLAPVRSAHDPEYGAIARDVMAMLGGYERDGHPVPEDGPEARWPPPGVDYEARASRGAKSLMAQKSKILLQSVLAWVLFRTGWNVGGFDPSGYRRETALNTDYRKYDDVLRLTVDCDPDVVARIEAMLAAAQARGVVRYGICRQDAALMTCIVPSVLEQDHMHFLDGADGGYARAAQALKEG